MCSLAIPRVSGLPYIYTDRIPQLIIPTNYGNFLFEFVCGLSWSFKAMTKAAATCLVFAGVTPCENLFHLDIRLEFNSYRLPKLARIPLRHRARRIVHWC